MQICNVCEEYLCKTLGHIKKWSGHMKIKLTHMWRKRERKKKSKRKGRENAKHENYRHTFRNYFAWQINLLYDCITSFIVLQTERKELFDPFFVYCSMLRIFSRIINRRRCMNERWTKKITAQRIYYTFAMLALAENFVNQRQWFKCGMRSSPKCMFIDCKWGHTHTGARTHSHTHTQFQEKSGPPGRKVMLLLLPSNRYRCRSSRKTLYFINNLSIHQIY